MTTEDDGRPAGDAGDASSSADEAATAESTVSTAGGAAYEAIDVVATSAPAVAPLEPEPPPAPTTATVDDLREAVGVARRAPSRSDARAEVRTDARDDDARDRERARERERDERDRERDRARRNSGARRRDRDDDDDRDDDRPLDPEARARRRKLWMTLSLSLVIGLVIVAFVFLGRANSSRLVFACGPSTISAEAGRSFPPWGTSRIDSPELAPITIPPQAECQSRETEDRTELEQWFLDALVEQAQAKLAAREVTAVDDAEKQLQQALLLARTPERRDQRRDIERLLGDVVYWRATAKTKAAIATLGEAAKLFDEAATRKPRNVSDAAAWADYTRAVAADLEAGPAALRDGGVPAIDPITPTRPLAPPGVALPVEPEADGDGGLSGAPSSPPDAGVPGGGVLL